MATVIAGSPSARELRMIFEDGAGETAPIIIPLRSSASDLEITSIVDDYVALSNAKLLEASVTDKLAITGFSVAGKPSASAMPIVAAILAMEFVAVNPLNSAKDVTRQVILPAYLAALRNDAVKPHVPVSGNSTLNDLVDLIGGALDYVGADAAHYALTWTFNPSSKFGTKATVTDGF